MTEAKFIIAYLIATHGPKTVTLSHPAVKKQVQNLRDFARAEEIPAPLRWVSDHSRRVIGIDSLPKLKQVLETGTSLIMDDLSRLFRGCPSEAERLALLRDLEPHGYQLVGLRQGKNLGNLSNSQIALLASGQLDPRYRYAASSKTTRNVEDGIAQIKAAKIASLRARRQAADSKAQELQTIRDALQTQSSRVTNKMIAERANEQGLRTTRGGLWRADTVAWSAPIGWSGLIVSASLAAGPMERSFLARVGDSLMRCAA